MGNYRMAAQLAASRVVLGATELVSYYMLLIMQYGYSLTQTFVLSVLIFGFIMLIH
jgi:hypothetical protein